MMSELELKESLSKVLEEHQHESGLHMIGGRQRLIDRLVQFFEEVQDKRSSQWLGQRSC
ncbi:MAG TPA: hypothetical protein VFA89_01155 [Terriglobales bacterium]|nr:hypothetical protein [Terriglobales bacterium]